MTRYTYTEVMLHLESQRWSSSSRCKLHCTGCVCNLSGRCCGDVPETDDFFEYRRQYVAERAAIEQLEKI